MKLSTVATAVSSLLTHSSTPTTLTSSLEIPLDLTLNTNPPIQIDPTKHLSDVIASSPLLSFHRALVEIPSISNDELAVAKYLQSYLEQHNFTVITQPVARPSDASSSVKTRLNILAYPKASSNDEVAGWPDRKVLLTSHIDTVPPFIPYNLSLPSSFTTKHRREEILISGRGTVDAKSCVAAQTHALLSLLSTHTIAPSDAALLFVVGEEVSGDGMHTFSSSHYSHANFHTVIFGEPTESQLATGHKGILILTLHARGKAAHSGYPWLGRSATSLLIQALNVIDALGEKLPRSAKFGNSTINVGKLSGGVAANVVAEHAYADIGIRLAAGTPEDTKIILETALRQLAQYEDLQIVYHGAGYGPVNLDGGVDGFEETTVNYGTDVPNLKVRGAVKRYLFGPGSITVAHGKDEGLAVGELEGAVGGYIRLVRHALGK